MTRSPLITDRIPAMKEDDPKHAAQRAVEASAAAVDALYLISSQLSMLAMALDELAQAADPDVRQQVANAALAAIEKAKSP